MTRRPPFGSPAAKWCGVRRRSSRWGWGESRTSVWRSATVGAFASRWARTAPPRARPRDVMQAAHYAAQTYADPIPPGALLEMQTINAAAAAGMESEVGSLEAGKRADVVARSPRAPGAHPANNPLHLLALTMGTGSVDAALVNGEIVLRGGRSTRVDEEDAYRAATESVIARARRLGIDPGPQWPNARG